MRLLSCICLLLAISFLSNAQTAIPGSWVTNGYVSSITRGDGKVFLGGSFDWVGPSYGSSSAVFNSTLTHDSSYPIFAEDVYAAESDGAGGWYVSSLSGMSHIKPDKTVETLAINIDGGFISAIEKVGNILYFGGSFTAVNGTARGNGAAYDITSGSLTTWNPNANSSIESLAASGSVLYAGGRFGTIGGQSRNRIAQLDASTALATTWNANVAGTGFVSAIAVGTNAVYFGGGFSNVGGGTPARTYFAAVNNTTGALLPFNPRPNLFVYNLVLDGNTIYMAGSFSQVGATDKPKFAAVDVTSGAFTSIAVTFTDNADITALAVDGQKLFIAGTFMQINGENRPRLAVVDKTTGALQPMNAGKISDVPYHLAVSNGNILVVADRYFAGVKGTTSGAIGLVALSETTGQSLDWTPEIYIPSGDGYPAGMDVHYQDNRVYFLQKIYHSSDGYYASNIGALNASDGSLINPFDISVDDVIDAWAFSDDALYLAGQFTDVNGESREGFAAIDLATGNVLPWTVNFVPGEGEVNSMMVHNNVVYIGGDFFFTDGEDRQNVAAFDATTGTLTDWAPEYFNDFPSPRIGAVTDEKVYIIGNGIYPLDATTGASDPGWLSLFNEARIYSMVIHGSAIYVGGYGDPDQTAMVARLDLATGEVTGTQPVLEDTYASEGSSVVALAISGSKLLVGGDFALNLNGVQRPYYAEYLLSEPGANSPPEIQTTTASVVAKGIATIDLEPLISDPDDNLDLSSLSLKSQSSEQGAAASLDGLILTLNYEGLAFTGTDHITIGICDLLAECAEQELNIQVKGDAHGVVVYNAVSPNGDKKNDFLMLEFIELFADNKVTIYNRWGDLVFDMSGYNNTDRVFKGVNKNGNELPSGTYFYKIELGGTKKDQSGYLSLKR